MDTLLSRRNEGYVMNLSEAIEHAEKLKKMEKDLQQKDKDLKTEFNDVITDARNLLAFCWGLNSALYTLVSGKAWGCYLNMFAAFSVAIQVLAAMIAGYICYTSMVPLKMRLRDLKNDKMSWQIDVGKWQNSVDQESNTGFGGKNNDSQGIRRLVQAKYAVNELTLMVERGKREMYSATMSFRCFLYVLFMGIASVGLSSMVVFAVSVHVLHCDNTSLIQVPTPT